MEKNKGTIKSGKSVTEKGNYFQPSFLTPYQKNKRKNNSHVENKRD
jgi:hypothetical protein